jgi:hypothetical protein
MLTSRRVIAALAAAVPPWFSPLRGQPLDTTLADQVATDLN